MSTPYEKGPRPSKRSATRHIISWRWLGNFALTVVCSAMLSALLVKKVRNPFRSSAASSKAPPSSTKKVAKNPKDTPAVVGKTEGLYRQHLEEIFRTLRSRSTIKMVRLEIPSDLLRFQRSPAGHEDGTFHLQGKADKIPVIAVSNRSRQFLEQMMVTYIDPKRLSPKVQKAIKAPFPPEQLGAYLLVPDLLGDNAALFTFEKR